jgi:N-dimethylarginine dimethylaminohydrolase
VKGEIFLAGTYQSDVKPIRTLLVKHAKDAFISDDEIHRQWQGLHYRESPDFARSVEEYDRFVEHLAGFGADLHFLPQSVEVGLDSMYVRDASIVCNKGVILCNMGKPERRNEPSAQKEVFRALGIPIHGTITGEGRLEGGDVVWVDEKTLAVARGYRTNDEGIRQLMALLGDCVDEVVVVPLPHWRGPEDVFHLMSIVSPLDEDLALVYSPLMPVPFREFLISRGMTLLEVPDSEFETMGCNVLALAPRRGLMLAGNPETQSLLERAGVDISLYEGQEISVKGAGGPTCLTRPLVRG